MSDTRPKGLSEAALRCRARRYHPIPDLLDALLGKAEGVRKVVTAGVTELQCVCRTPGCGVIVIDLYNSVGHHVGHRLKYPKDEDGNDLYLQPKGSGRIDPDDLRAEIFDRAREGLRQSSPRRRK